MNVHSADEAARPPARVVLSSPGVMSAADERLLLELLADCGLNARVESVPVRRGDAAASVVPLILVDPGTGLRIVLDADLPEGAYATLVTLDLSQFSIGPLHYDLARQRWRSELDEAAGG